MKSSVLSICTLLLLSVPAVAQARIYLEKVLQAQYTPGIDREGCLDTEVDGTKITARRSATGMKLLFNVIPNFYGDSYLPFRPFITDNYLLAAIEVRDQGTTPTPAGWLTLKYIVTDGVTRQYVDHVLFYQSPGAPIMGVRNNPDDIAPASLSTMTFTGSTGRTTFTYASDLSLQNNRITLLSGKLNFQPVSSNSAKRETSHRQASR